MVLPRKLDLMRRWLTLLKRRRKASRQSVSGFICSQIELLLLQLVACCCCCRLGTQLPLIARSNRGFQIGASYLSLRDSPRSLLYLTPLARRREIKWLLNLLKWLPLCPLLRHCVSRGLRVCLALVAPNERQQELAGLRNYLFH